MTYLLQSNYISPDESQIMEKQINELIEHSIVSNDYNSEDSETGNIRQKMCQLRREHDLKWAEQAALFYKKTAICLMEKRDDKCTDCFNRAIALYQWMCEDSRYLHVNHFSEIKNKREEIEQEIDFISLQKEIWSIIKQSLTLEYIESIINKLEHSGYLCKYATKTNIVTNLIELDSEVFKDHIPTFIKIIYLLNENNLLQDSHRQRIEKITEHHIALRETEIAAIWFSNKQEESKKLLENNILETSALLLLADEHSELQYPKNVLSARICRYLTKFENPYTNQLKNKAYTLLAGECSLENHFGWDDLLSFNLPEFICKVANLLIEELDTLADNDENKWEQYSNGQNTLTLDKDGFTISNQFSQPIRSWKAKKDRASLMDNRASIVSFGKPTYLFEKCKSIADHYLYWKQFQNEFPLYQPEPVPASANGRSSSIGQVMKADQPQKQYPNINDEVTIGIVKINTKGEYWEGIILDKTYRGTKVILPYTQLNACYFRIKEFSQLFSANDSLKVKVMEINKEGVRVSLAQYYNEYTYAENMRRKQMPAMLADCEDGKLKWLLPTGVTAVTTLYRWIKPHIGDFYKVEFQGTSGGTMRALIDVCQVKAPVVESEFQAEVMKHLLEFKAFTQQLQTKAQIQQEEQNLLKLRNNPFAALQQLKTILEDTNQPYTSSPEENGPSAETATISSTPSVTMSRHTAEELVYCLDLFIQDMTEPTDQLDAYCFMQLLCHLVGYEETAAYYQICADYLYDIHTLALRPGKERFTEESLHDFNILQARMEQVGVECYATTLENYSQIIQLLCSIPENDYTRLQCMIKHENKAISELARYFSMIPYLGNEDNELQEIIYKCINKLLGFKEVCRKEVVPPTPVFFGHEGVRREFKSTAFIHSDKNADEAQIVVLARVLASFMNTDGGTLYIGVNDNGYLGGLETDLKMCHYDSDVYLRSVNIGLIRKLGDGKEDQNRYQEYIRCALHEYNDGRIVLAFCVPPLNEVVKVNGNVYTRSGSSTIIKPMENVKDFIAQRRGTPLDSTPCMPEFPTLFSEKTQEYIFNESASNIAPVSNPIFPIAEEKKVKPQTPASDKKKKAHIDIRTSILRPNPLQKKAEMGYTNTFQFVSFFTNGKIACSPSPKIGVWGETDGKVIFSYDTEGCEELLVSVFRNGEVGVSNLKKGFSQSNTPIAFLSSLDNLLFSAPATKQDYLLLISEKEGEKRYRLITLADFERPLGLQPKLVTILSPEKGTYIFAEILHADQLEDIENEKLSLNSFDIYNAGRLWEHADYKKDISIITELCKLDF